MMEPADHRLDDAFDRFGRTIRQQWDKYNTGAGLRDRFDYKYDYAGNRLSRDIDNTLYGTNDRDEAYQYDGLLRLKNAQRGTLASGAITSRKFEQDWSLDALGNWSTFKERDTDVSTWDLDQPRTHNKANELTAIGATTGTDWYEPTQDAAGNMLLFPNPKAPGTASALVYDAWNRPVSYWAANLSISKPVAVFEYDALHRRIVKTTDADANGTPEEIRHFYYTKDWQVVEERLEVSGAQDADPVNQYVWQPHYVDALALRRYDADTDGNFAENQDGAYYYLQDANYNVTAQVNASGAVVERYAYTPYGAPTILNGASDADGAVTEWTADSSQAAGDNGNAYLFTGREYDWETGLQINRWRYYAAHLGRWLTRDPDAIHAPTNSLVNASQHAHLYNYVANLPPILLDPSGLREIAKPCGTFEWNPYKDPGRPYPGWQVGFDPTGCKCKGTIKLVQVINDLGWFSSSPQFDIGDDVPPDDTIYPGYCETGGRCGDKNPRFPDVDGPIQDAPDIVTLRAEGHEVTICAVCDEGATETLLGCINFATNDDETGFDLIEPNKTGACIKGGRYPSTQPNEIWDNAEEDLDDGVINGKPIKWPRPTPTR